LSSHCARSFAGSERCAGASVCWHTRACNDRNGGLCPNAQTLRRVSRGGENPAGETCVLVGGQLAQLLERVPLGQHQPSQAPARAEGPESTLVMSFRCSDRAVQHLFGATNRFPIGQRGILYIWRSSSGVTKPNALRLICSELLLDHLRYLLGTHQPILMVIGGC
jgi:hypothetical protein